MGFQPWNLPALEPSLFERTLFSAEPYPYIQRALHKYKQISAYRLGTKRSSSSLNSVDLNWESKAKVDRKNDIKRPFLLISKWPSCRTSQQIQSTSLLSLLQSWSKFSSGWFRSKLANWPISRVISRGSSRSAEDPALKTSQKHSIPNE